MKPDLFDVLALGGLVMLGAGLWMVWPPLGLIVPGGILVIVGVMGGIMRARRAG